MNSSSSSDKHTALRKAVYRILQGFVRLLMRNGVVYQEIAELTRRAYVDCALNDASDEGKRMTDSRIAVLTGLTRKEVKKQRELLQRGTPFETETGYSRAERVISGWLRDGRYESTGQQPTLPLQGEISFESLVREYSGDMTMRAMLDELVTAGVVVEENSTVKLLQRAYIPRGDDAQMVKLFGREVSDLMETMDHNLNCADMPDLSKLQLSVSYDQIPAEYLEEWRELVGTGSHELLQELNRWLSERDGDRSGNTRPENPIRLGLSLFSIESAPEIRQQQHLSNRGS